MLQKSVWLSSDSMKNDSYKKCAGVWVNIHWKFFPFKNHDWVLFVICGHLVLTQPGAPDSVTFRNKYIIIKHLLCETAAPHTTIRETMKKKIAPRRRRKGERLPHWETYCFTGESLQVFAAPFICVVGTKLSNGSWLKKPAGVGSHQKVNVSNFLLPIVLTFENLLARH